MKKVLQKMKNLIWMILQRKLKIQNMKTFQRNSFNYKKIKTENPPS